EIQTVEFAADSKTLLSVGTRTTQLWDLRNRKSTLVGKGTAERLSYERSKEFPVTGGLHPSGKMRAPRIFPGTAAETIAIPEACTGKTIQTLKGHRDGFSSLAFSKNGKWLAAGELETGAVRLWEVATWKQVRQFPDREREFHCLAFSPDGKT